MDPTLQSHLPPDVWQVELVLPLDVTSLSLAVLAASSSLEVVLNASSAGRDVQPLDNVLKLRLPLAALVDLELVGRASPELGLLPEDLPEDNRGKVVGFTHTYEVRTGRQHLVLQGLSTLALELL